ncbi:MAG: protoporphyrinogen oxidase [Actinomycetota bacterium]|nr:protoporphyrinogen oxidase [Actinomycetota bacterium]
MTHVAVVGGGITGLAAAWELLGSGARVTLLDAADRLGGRIVTAEVGGRPVDLGPDAFLSRVPEALELCRQLGLDSELVSPAADQAFVWVRGRLRRLPAGVVLGAPTDLVSLARSGVLSPAGLARATLDLVLPASRDGGHDRSVGDLVRARLGRQVHERLVDPLVGGIHAGPSELLSVRATAPQLAAAAAERRSLVAGLRAQRRASPPAPGPMFHSLREGLARLVVRLEEELRAGGVAVELATPVKSLAALRADATVVAAPATVAADLLAGSPQAAAELRSIDHASVGLAVLVYPADAFPRPPVGSGFLVPRREGRLLTACSFASAKWPHWAAPGQVVLRASAGRWGDQRALAMADEELVGRLHADLADALGLTDAPSHFRVTRWRDAFPQYRVGHLERVARIEAAVARDLRRVAVAGPALGGVGIPACIAQGRRAARLVLA